MTPEPFDQISGYLRLLKAVSARYEGRITAAAAAQGLTKPEADVLLFLANNPQFRTAREVVSRRGLSKAYVSKAVEQLTDRGLLTARLSVADRRVQQLHLTAEAMAQLKPGATVTLYRDAALTQGIVVDQKVTLANGSSLKIDYGGLLDVASGGILRVNSQAELALTPRP